MKANVRQKRRRPRARDECKTPGGSSSGGNPNPFGDVLAAASRIAGTDGVPGGGSGTVLVSGNDNVRRVVGDGVCDSLLNGTAINLVETFEGFDAFSQDISPDQVFLAPPPERPFNQRELDLLRKENERLRKELATFHEEKLTTLNNQWISDQRHHAQVSSIVSELNDLRLKLNLLTVIQTKVRDRLSKVLDSSTYVNWLLLNEFSFNHKIVKEQGEQIFCMQKILYDLGCLRDPDLNNLNSTNKDGNL